MSVITSIRLGNRDLALTISPRARSALARAKDSFYIEMELYFSCLLRKRVNFLGVQRAGAVATAPLSEHVRVYFRPVMTRSCAVSDSDDQPELEAFPLKRAEAFTPRWLTIDFRAGKWSGDFGY